MRVSWFNRNRSISKILHFDNTAVYRDDLEPTSEKEMFLWIPIENCERGATYFASRVMNITLESQFSRYKRCWNFGANDKYRSIQTRRYPVESSFILLHDNGFHSEKGNITLLCPVFRNVSREWLRCSIESLGWNFQRQIETWFKEKVSGINAFPVWIGVIPIVNNTPVMMHGFMVEKGYRS